MSTKVPHRSRRGCLTCKRRKKKCDETRPECTRCRDGNFDCLGYDYLDTPGASTSRIVVYDSGQDETLPNTQQSSSPSSNLGSWVDNPPLSQEQGCVETQQWDNRRCGVQLYGQPRITVPRSIRVDPMELDNMVQFIVSQHSRFSQGVIFQPFPFSIQTIMAQRAKSSPYLRWSMYIMARIGQALIDGTSWHPCIGWIDSFHRRITNIPSTSETDVDEIATRLDALNAISMSAFMIMNSPAGYALCRHCTPLFLQLAARFPEIWTNDSAISISHALHSRHEITQFVFTDTVTALVFSVPPLIHYDTTIHPEDWSQGRPPVFLEWVYGWPSILTILFAKINSSTVSRQLSRTPMNPDEQLEIGERLEGWKPIIDNGEHSSRLIARLAIQECWRHAVLIYMYMGACGVDSADPRVEASVRQVAQLASTVEEPNPLETHLRIPCLIAGVAARKEKHRKVFHKKLSYHGLNIFPLRGADFIYVLDHLWHGAASGGRAVTWDDYANSRSVALPIDV